MLNQRASIHCINNFSLNNEHAVKIQMRLSGSQNRWANMTNLMKAIQINEHGDTSVLKLHSVPILEPGPEDALISLKAAGLNFIDIYQRTGRYPGPVPYIPGREGCGTVEAVGKNVKTVKI